MTDFEVFGDHQIAPRFAIFARLGQSAQDFKEFSDKDAIAPCPSCGHTGLTLVRMPVFSTRSVAKRCGRCDVFRGWEPEPQKKGKQQRGRKSPSRQQKAFHAGEGGAR